MKDYSRFARRGGLKIAFVSLFLGALGSLWGGCLPSNVAVAQEMAQASVPRYLALANGQVMHGVVTTEGNRYHLQLPVGVVSFEREQVVQVADSLQEIYAQRTSNIPIDSVSRREEMVSWCLQYHLLDEAETEWNILRLLAPDSSRTEALGRRIEYARKAASAQQTQSPSASSESAISSVVPEENVSPQELQRMADSLPQDAVELFRKRIQPVLTRNCMESGCHGPDSTTGFKLLRVTSATPRTTLLKNIRTSLQFIDTERPEESAFLRKPVLPHGPTNREEIIFPCAKYGSYQLLIAWTYLVTRNEYVIPRETLLPPLRLTPTYTPTQSGLRRISSHSLPSGSLFEMYGVHESLLPQTLYPEEYTRPTPNVYVPPLRILPQEGVVPASSNLPIDAPSGVTPASAQEPAESLEPEEGAEWTPDMAEEYIRPARIYAPGESSGDIRHVNPAAGLAPSPVPSPQMPTPQETMRSANPVEVHNRSMSDGAYNYELQREKPPVQQRPREGVLLWEQMLELQKIEQAPR
ncbi:MAG: hypothetical protein Q4D38_06860 [Planctomycetia bacterium]|nr:hypothetical protein [Planctomycetia bacterium]